MLSYLCTSPLSRADIEIVAADPIPRFAFKGFAPNPLSGSGAFFVELGESANRVSIRIFDVAGRSVRTLTATGLSPGSYSIPWDGRNSAGRAVPNGIYFVRAGADEQDHQTSKVLVIR